MNMATNAIKDEESISDEAEEKIIYKCESCNTTFSDVEDHMREFHPGDNRDDSASEECLENIVEVEGMAFVIKNADGKFECTECMRQYKSLRRFLDHAKTHGSVTSDSVQKLENLLKEVEDSEEIYDQKPLNDGSGKCIYCCKVCNTIFDSRKKMLLHYSIHENVARAQKKRQGMAEDFLNCKLCNKSLRDEGEMTMHMKAHAENQAQGSGAQADAKKAKSESKGAYPCQYCQKLFKRPHEKVKHERIHTGEKPYSCEICGKQFRVTYCLSLHKKNVHSEERPYVCSVANCNKRFKSQSVYNHHINTHGTAKNFKCTFCPKAFKTSVQLAGHKNTHTKPFACQICSRVFASLYAVKIHMEVHRNLDTNLKFQCKICSAQYGRSFALQDHLKTAHPGMENVSAEDDEHYVIEEPAESEESPNVDDVYSIVVEL